MCDGEDELLKGSTQSPMLFDGFQSGYTARIAVRKGSQTNQDVKTRKKRKHSLDSTDPPALAARHSSAAKFNSGVHLFEASQASQPSFPICSKFFIFSLHLQTYFGFMTAAVAKPLYCWPQPYISPRDPVISVQSSPATSHPTSMTSQMSASAPISPSPSHHYRLPSSSQPSSCLPHSNHGQRKALRPLSESGTSSIRVYTEADLFKSFQSEPLLALASAFYDSYSNISDRRNLSLSTLSNDHSAQSKDHSKQSIAKFRFLYSKAVSARKSFSQGDQQASADYARSIITPVWNGLPVDVISLVTTGKPSASGPFALSSLQGSSARASGTFNSRLEGYLFGKLLREDESNSFALREVHSNLPSTGQQESPYLQYAPTKADIVKYFTGYFARHPLAPLIINEKIFLDDLANDTADPLLLNVVIGSAIAVSYSSNC